MRYSNHIGWILSAALSLGGIAHAAPAKKPAAAKKAAAKKAAAPKKTAKAKDAPVAAGEGPLAGQVAEYLAAHGFEARTVKVDRGGAKVTRTFVPVIKTSYEDFMTRFTAKSESMVWRHFEDDKTHGKLYLGLDRGIYHPQIWHAKPNDAGRIADIREKDGDWQAFSKGRYVTIHLGKALLAKAEKFYKTAVQPKEHKAGCMWWLAYAKLGNTPLAHALGVRRSIDIPNLVAKWMHAGNERIAVIGVPVKDLAEFKAMKEADLMGPPPAGGAFEAVHEL